MVWFLRERKNVSLRSRSTTTNHVVLLAHDFSALFPFFGDLMVIFPFSPVPNVFSTFMVCFVWLRGVVQIS